MATMPKPFRTSPLIRVSRWSFLAAGIFYGFTRNKALTMKENARREQEEKERPAREAAMAIEKQKAYEEEMRYMSKEFGI